MARESMTSASEPALGTAAAPVALCSLRSSALMDSRATRACALLESAARTAAYLPAASERLPFLRDSSAARSMRPTSTCGRVSLTAATMSRRAEEVEVEGGGDGTEAVVAAGRAVAGAELPAGAAADAIICCERA